VRRSNHYGIAGWYALRAASAGMIGMSLTNSSPLVAPTRARVPMIGTNPIAVAAPAGRFGSLCLDMATSTVPRGRIEVASRRGETLPVGWAIDAEGHPATTPAAALGGSLQPLGGGEETAGYKGYGLSLIVDLLTGVLGGAAFGPNIIPLFSTHDGIADLGQLFWVIDPAALGDDAFEARLEAYCAQLVEAPLIPGAPGRVLIPGEPEAAAERRATARGIVIDREHHEKLGAIGDRFGVPLPVATAPLPWSAEPEVTA
jgi:LDH2 family malate/lactate/ureidoglycolate dehydrogenase